jgi:hypothetical protein
MDIRSITAEIETRQMKGALDEFLLSFLDPAFGALPKGEVELLVLRLLTQIGAVSERPNVYELVGKLRVTRSKARQLIYAQELRSRTVEELEADIRELLRRPILQKRGDLFKLEVENPLVSDHLRAKLQELGHATDGSFSPSLVTITLEGMVALIEAQLSKAERETTFAALVRAGAPDKSLRGVLRSALKRLGEKVADEAGGAIAGEVADYIGPLLESRGPAITAAFRSLFAGRNDSSA